MDEKIIKKIDKTIKYIWKHKMPKEYNDVFLLNEDTMKNVIFYYLRKYLGNYFYKNDIRIFTEFTNDKFQDSSYRPDIIIAKMDFNKDTKYFSGCIDKLLCVFELKYKSGFNPSNDIYNDFEKLKTYVNELKIDCPLYMATIWEYEDKETSWERKNAAWAKDRLTELNASYEPGTQNMRFYISEHMKNK